MARKNWIAVASADHARRGCEIPADGFMQVCHGQCAPLKRVAPGDRVAYYAPTQTMGGRDKLQKFVSLGVVQAGLPYVFDAGGGFTPFRRHVAYVPANEASIGPLIDQFNFVENRQRWGYRFRFGMFEIDDHDMRLIAAAMAADSAGLGLQADAPADTLPLHKLSASAQLLLI